MTVTKACPHIKATAIDLPQVAPIAQKIVESEGAADRVRVLAADVLSGPLPGSYDVVILRALLQVLSSEDARLAVKNIGAAINPGGKIYIIGQILDDSRISPPEAVGFNLSLINRIGCRRVLHGARNTEIGSVTQDSWTLSVRISCCLTNSGVLTARKRE